MSTTYNEIKRHLEIESSNPNDVGNLRSLGRLWNELGDLDNSLSYYDKALAKAKEKNERDYQMAIYLDKYQLLFNEGRYEESAICAKDAANLTGSVNAKVLQGVAMYRLGRYKQIYAQERQEQQETYYYDAIKCFDEVIHNSHGQDKARALKNKGNALSLLKRYQEAVVCYNEAIKMYPGYVAAFTNKGNALYGLEDFEGAISCYDAAIRIFKNSGNKIREIDNEETVINTTYLHRGMANYGLGHLSVALEDYSNVYDSEISSDLRGLKYLNMAICYHKLNHLDKAERYYNTAIENNFNLWNAHYDLAGLYLKLKNKDEAKEQLRLCAKNSKKLKEKATSVLDQLEVSNTLDWYSWWFGKTNGKYKKIFGMIIIGFIFSLVLAIAYVSATMNSLSSTNLAGLSLAIGILVIILILPSLKKAKLGSYIELEIISFVTPSDAEIEVVIPMTGYYGMH